MVFLMAKTRINEIDLLRFMAAFSVVLFHYTFRGYAADSMSVIPYPLLAPYSKYGYLGVELFFMISGFVILMSASGGNMRRFVVSRFIRLYPAFWASCTITFIVILLIGEPRYTATLSQYLINMTMISGYLHVPSIDGVYWTLFIELQFYFLIAILLFMKKISHIESFLTLWIILSIILELFPIKILNFLLIVNFSAYFISGAIFYLIWLNGLSWRKVAVLFLAWGLSLLQEIHYMVEFEHHYNTDLNVFIVGGILTSFFIVMLLMALKKTGKLGQKQWILAGSLTYPLYLLHQNIGFMIFNSTYGLLSPFWLFFMTLGSVLLLSYMVHIFIEKQFSSPLKVFVNNTIDAVYRLKIK
ncbi:acyltransferase [Sulfuricurvum sp.]|uniref:acyltransferase family protein n=1 Tax=Sulfuricurvum sp. TaxID=2025608 RepID=UPI002616B1B9|nr:acyltransferase [Sulfuricurvum sp.]